MNSGALSLVPWPPPVGILSVFCSRQCFCRSWAAEGSQTAAWVCAACTGSKRVQVRMLGWYEAGVRRPWAGGPSSARWIQPCRMCCMHHAKMMVSNDHVLSILYHLVLATA